jgi:hypothetical protein
VTTKNNNMALKTKNISIQRDSRRSLNISSESSVLALIFIVALIGSLSIGGLFLKEITLGGVIISLLMILKENK